MSAVWKKSILILLKTKVSLTFSSSFRSVLRKFTPKFHYDDHLHGGCAISCWGWVKKRNFTKSLGYSLRFQFISKVRNLGFLASIFLEHVLIQKSPIEPFFSKNHPWTREDDWNFHRFAVILFLGFIIHKGSLPTLTNLRLKCFRGKSHKASFNNGGQETGCTSDCKVNTRLLKIPLKIECFRSHLKLDSWPPIFEEFIMPDIF